MKKLFLLLVIILLRTFDAQAETVKVIDGDSLVINGKMIRLVGIDAPEFFQKCRAADGSEYECGQEALEYMRSMIDIGKKRGDKISCKKKDVDKYDRDLCICRMGKVNLNKKMVEAGWAVAYRHKWYEEAQNEAKNARKGMWQGDFMRPELYRILRKYQKTRK